MTHYLTANLGYAWHCELCSLPIASLPDSYGCLAAIADYVYRYPEAKSFDPSYHYKVLLFIFLITFSTLLTICSGLDIRKGTLGIAAFVM